MNIKIEIILEIFLFIKSFPFCLTYVVSKITYRQRKKYKSLLEQRKIPIISSLQAFVCFLKLFVINKIFYFMQDFNVNQSVNQSSLSNVFFRENFAINANFI